MKRNVLVEVFESEQLEQLKGFTVQDILSPDDEKDSITITLKKGDVEKVLHFSEDNVLYVTDDSVLDESAFSPVECVIAQMMKRDDISDTDKEYLAMQMRSSCS